MAGCTPSVENRFHEHSAAATFSGNWPPSPDTLYEAHWCARANCSKLLEAFTHSAKLAGDTTLSGYFGSLTRSYNITRRSGSLYGNGFSSTDRTTVKSAAF